MIRKLVKSALVAIVLLAATIANADTVACNFFENPRFSGDIAGGGYVRLVDNSGNPLGSDVGLNCIKEIYRSTLNREADQAGLNYWVYKLAPMSYRGPQPVFMRPSQVRRAFAESAEGTALITSLYHHHLGREPDAGGLQYYRGFLGLYGYGYAQVFNSIYQSEEARRFRGEIP